MRDFSPHVPDIRDGGFDFSMGEGYGTAPMMNNDYMAHGFCFSWETPLVILHVASDIVTAIAYYSIPIAMFYFAYRRRDVPFFNIFTLFALFILSCGTTHFFAALTVFDPVYWLEGLFVLFTFSCGGDRLLSSVSLRYDCSVQRTLHVE